MPEAATSGPTVLKIPAQSEYIGLAKRAAPPPGGRVGGSLDETEELSNAVTQAGGSHNEAADEAWGPGGTLRLSFTPTERGVLLDVDAIAPRATEALRAVRRAHAATHNSAELEMQRALVREMIRPHLDDFRHQVDTGRRQIRYRMVKYLVS